MCFTSNNVHEESEPAPYAAMKWLSPFGKLFQGDILGTKDFPSLRLPDFLTKQVDRCNCGMGIVASIAIIVLQKICIEKVDQMLLFIEQLRHQARL